MDAVAPSSLARSSSASDIMEPFIAERVKGEDSERDPISIPNPPHPQSRATSYLLAGNNHTAQPISQSFTSSSPTALTFSYVPPLSFEARDEGSVYDQPWLQIGSQRCHFSSDRDSAIFSSEKEIDANGCVIGAEVEEGDLFSSIRDYLTHRGVESKEEAGERGGPGDTSENVYVNLPALIHAGVARSKLDYTGQLREAKQVLRKTKDVSKSVGHSSADSTEENETEQRSIYECIEMQCQWPSLSVKGKTSIERNTRGKKGVGTNTETRLEGKFDIWNQVRRDKKDDKEAKVNDRSSLMRQDVVDSNTEPPPQPLTQLK